MKAFINFFIIFILAFSASEGNAQVIAKFGPACSDYNMQVGLQYWRSCPGRIWLFPDWNCCACRIGNRDNWPTTDNWVEYRLFYEWTIPQTAIPYGSTINYVNVTITYQPSTPNLNVLFYKIDRHLSAQDQEASEILKQTYSNDIGSGYGSGGSITRYFGSGTAFVAAVQSMITSQSTDNFFSLGVKANIPQTQMDEWTINCCSLKIEIGFIPPLVYDVMITNVVDGIVHYKNEDSYVRGDDNIYDSNGNLDWNALPQFERPPVYKNWYMKKDHVAETWFTKYVQTHDLIPEKHLKWNDEKGSYRIKRWVPNYLGEIREFLAYSENIVKTTINANIELYIPKDDIAFDFWDPWRVDQDPQAWRQCNVEDFVEQRTPYRPQSDPLTHGVFLDQRWENPTDPFYAVRTWRYLDYDPGLNVYDKKGGFPLKEGDGIFMEEIVQTGGWFRSPYSSILLGDFSTQGAAYREHRVEFKQDNSVLTGRYKAHLMSDNETQPTMRSNQRKIDIDPLGVYHAVYESAGAIWYVQSSDKGNTWSREEIVSDYEEVSLRPSPGATNPCIAVYDSSVYVVYMDGGKVQLRRRYKGQWQDYYDNSSWATNLGSETTPVVDAGKACKHDMDNLPKGELILVVWEAPNELKYSAIYQHRYVSDYQIQAGECATQINDQPRFPSIDCGQIDMHFGVSWRDYKKIYFKNISLWSCNTFWVDDACQIEEVSDSFERAVYAPSITHDARLAPVIAYEVSNPYFGPYSRRWITVKTKSQSPPYQWNTTSAQVPYYSLTAYTDPINPSLGSHYTNTDCGGYDEPGLRVAYHQNWGGGIQVLRLDCTPSIVGQVSNGASFPSIVSYAPAGDLLSVYSAPYQSPFSFAVRSANAGIQKAASVSLRRIRDVRVSNGADYMLCGISNPQLLQNNTDINAPVWQPAHDTLVIGVNTTLEAKMRTSDFHISGCMIMTFDQVLYCTNPSRFSQNLGFSIQFRKSATSELVASYELFAQALPPDSAKWSPRVLDLTSLNGETVYMTVGIVGDRDSAIVSVSNVYIDEPIVQKLLQDERRNVFSPNEITLEQNLPNPFASSTSITFSIPVEADVQLAVYDNLGRKVKTVVSGYRGPGRYTYSFDAGSLPSGMYFYRLDANGASIMKKMIVAR